MLNTRNSTTQLINELVIFTILNLLVAEHSYNSVRTGYWQVFYLREYNLVWIVKRSLLWKLLIKLLHSLPKIILQSLDPVESHSRLFFPSGKDWSKHGEGVPQVQGEHLHQLGSRGVGLRHPWHCRHCPRRGWNWGRFDHHQEEMGGPEVCPHQVTSNFSMRPIFQNILVFSGKSYTVGIWIAN